MKLEHAVFYKLANVALNGCTCLQLSKSIDFLFSLNLRMHVWNSVSRGTFYNVNDFLQDKFFKDNLYT
jgi:hypothetical protein